MIGKSEHKAKTKAWTALGANIIGTSGYGTATLLKARTSTTQKALDARKSRPAFVPERGIGLTPRLFDALMHGNPAPVEALPSSYLPTISRHVESIAPSKQVFAQYWCPVVVENKAGSRQIMHVDPIVVRSFRRTVAEELQHVRGKRSRMLKRIKHIREEFPHSESSDIAARLRREIDAAKGRADEMLLRPLPESISALHICLEVTPYMLQLELVCQRLVQELPAALAAAGVQRITFSTLSSESSGADALPSLPPFDWRDAEAWSVACEWLSALRTPLSAKASLEGKTQCGFTFGKALRWATTCEAFDASSSPAVMLVSCSKPLDIEACIALARRSGAPLQMLGVFGLSPEDPESGLQELADAAATGSSFGLFFGSAYWSQFVAARERQLQTLEGAQAADSKVLSGDHEIVSAKVFEMRLIERIMLECYSEEQQCEEELTCATRVFERTLVEREDLLSVLRSGRINSHTASLQATMPATAR